MNKALRPFFFLFERQVLQLANELLDANVHLPFSCLASDPAQVREHGTQLVGMPSDAHRVHMLWVNLQEDQQQRNSLYRSLCINFDCCH